jgi:DNA-binding NarL/FixJ family response regulator
MSPGFGSTCGIPAHPKLRIFLADDHAVVRAGLKVLINREAGLHVVGEASDGEEALASVPALKPDVVVLDISMPKLSGPETAARLRRTCPGARIIGLSVHEDRSYLRELIEAGATGYVLKRSTSEELIRAIRAVAGGGVYVDPAMAGDLVRSFVHPTTGSGFNAALSERESDVLRLLAEGHTTRVIAEKFEISTKTVETYKSRAMEKLGLKTRVDIIRHARASGWFSP